MAEFTQAQLDEIYNDLTRRGVIPQRKPITEYGNPKFTAGRPVGVHSDGYIPRSLIQTSDLTSLLSGTYAAAVHVHSGADITTGTVVDARIDAAIARDSEVAATYLPSASYTAADVLTKLLTVDTNTSGLNADTLDGVQGAGYALAAHTQAMSTITDYTAATSWTPELRVNASATGITYSANRIGRYSRWGSNLVVHFDFTLTNKGASVGNAEIYGLPVAVSALGGIGAVFFSTLTTNHISIIGRAGGSIIELWGSAAAVASLTRVTGAHLANTTRLHGTIIYNV